jgi:DnaK suppressor protein
MDTNKYKKMLEDAKTQLELNLSKIAHRDPKNPDDWQATNPEIDVQSADPMDMADKFEELETRAGLEEDMEGELNKVIKALKRIEDGSYGKCEKCGELIDERRLEVSPAASMCIEHADNI